MVAAVSAGVVLWPGGTEPSRAQPPPGADVFGAGIHLTASVDNVRVDPAGNRTPNFLMTFAHAAQLSGDYSLNVEGDGVTSGQAVAGFLLGCAISVAGGVTVGIEPLQGLQASISPSFSQPTAGISQPGATLTPVTTTPSATLTPVPTTPSASTTSQLPVPTSQLPVPTSQLPVPTSQSVVTTSQSTDTTSPSTSASPPSASLGPSVGGNLGLQEVLTANLGPGQITTATTVTATLDDTTVFPYHFIFNNAALNVAQCASPVSAVPFVTASVSTPVGIVQTTAYGTQFTF